MTQLIPEEKEVEGKIWTMHYMDPIKSHKLLTRTVRMVGPAFGDLLDRVFQSTNKPDEDSDLVSDAAPTDGAFSEEELDSEINLSFLGKASTALFDNLDVKLTTDIIEAFAKKSFIDGVALHNTISVQFRGRLDLLYQWLFWGLAVQWGKCFAGLPALTASTKKQSIPKTPKSE